MIRHLLEIISRQHPAWRTCPECTGLGAWRTTTDHGYEWDMCNTCHGQGEVRPWRYLWERIRHP